MAGEFVIETLEPRQLLSSSPTTTPPPAAAGAVTVAATCATASTASTTTISTSATATTITDTGKIPAFVRPGASVPTSTTSASTQGSTIPWGTDIYPPPIFTGTGGHGTARTTVLVGPAAPTSITTQSGSSTTPITILPPRTIIIGPRRGTSGLARHFSVRPFDEHPGRPGSAGVSPQIISTPASHPTRFATNTFADASLSAQSHAAPAIATFSTAGSAFPGIGLANWTPAVTATETAAYIGGRASPIGAASAQPSAPSSASPDSPAAPGTAGRAMRPQPATGLAGLLLPLATMDTSVISTGGAAVSKWEVDVALGSLSVVVAGYWYLCDAAARRRRQRATAVSVFCEKLID